MSWFKHLGKEVAELTEQTGDRSQGRIDTDVHDKTVAVGLEVAPAAIHVEPVQAKHGGFHAVGKVQVLNAHA